MGETADAVIIGSGGFGAAVADNLARRGLSVALPDRQAMASQPWPRSAGIAALPALVDAPVSVPRGAMPTMTVDGQHLVGPVPGGAAAVDHSATFCRSTI